MTARFVRTLGILTLLTPLPVVAGSAAGEAILPPLVPWDGKSRELALAPTDEWATPAERSGLTETPRYDETVAWVERLVAAAPELSMVSLGKSGEGRDVWMVIASRDGGTPEASRCCWCRGGCTPARSTARTPG